MQEDPEITEFKSAAADTAHDVKEAVKPDEKASSKSSSDKTILESVSFCFSVCPCWISQLHLHAQY